MKIEVLLNELAKPAQRAIANAGVKTLEQLSNFSEFEILALHGIGINAIAIIKTTLNENGLTLKKA